MGIILVACPDPWVDLLGLIRQKNSPNIRFSREREREREREQMMLDVIVVKKHTISSTASCDFIQGTPTYIYNSILFLFTQNTSKFSYREWKHQETKQKVRRRQEEFIY